jgi:hypothetical protein
VRYAANAAESVPRPPATAVVVAALAVTFGPDDPPQAAVTTTSSNPAATSPAVANGPPVDRPLPLDRERERFDIECFLSVGITHPNLVDPAERAFNRG